MKEQEGKETRRKEIRVLALVSQRALFILYFFLEKLCSACTRYGYGGTRKHACGTYNKEINMPSSSTSHSDLLALRLACPSSLPPST